MRSKSFFSGVFAAFLTACAAGQGEGVTTPSSLAGSYVLSAVDGKPAGVNGFTLRLEPGGSYEAGYDCRAHFGRYTFGRMLVLEPAASTPGGCDQEVLSGPAVAARDPRVAQDFFGAGRFSVARTTDGLDLRAGKHLYRLLRQ